MSLLRASQWTYDTSASGGVGVEFVAATGGMVVLRNPTKEAETFYYGEATSSVEFDVEIAHVELPKWTIPELKDREREIAGYAPSFKRAGSIYMTDAFLGHELARSDLEGGTLYIDAKLSLFYGQAGSALLLGINAAQLMMGLSSSASTELAQRAIAQAPALMFMGGTTVGMLAGGGIGMRLGYLH